MARRLRIEFEGAISHVMARGNGRQQIVRDDEDASGCSRTFGAAERSGWEVLAFVFLSNHLHLLVRTPRPNLGRGMQQFLSSYALWYGGGDDVPGICFRGGTGPSRSRTRATTGPSAGTSTSIPCAGLVERPADWRWSSYPGYARASARLPWVAYDVLLSAWQGDSGGTGPGAGVSAVRRGGARIPPPSPFREAIGGWVLGSERFLARLHELAGPLTSDPPSARGRPAPRS